MNLLRQIPLPTSSVPVARFGRTADALYVLYRAEEDGTYHVVSFSLNPGNDTRQSLWSQPHQLHTLAVSPDGGRLATHDDTALLLLTLDGSTPPLRLPTRAGSVTDLAWRNPSELILAYALDWPPLLRYDLHDRQASPLEPPIHDASQHRPCLAVSRDGSRLAFGHVFEHLTVFDLQNDTHHTWPVDPAAYRYREDATRLIRRFWFSSDGQRLAAASYPRDKHQTAQMELLIGSRDGTEAVSPDLDTHMAAVDCTSSLDRTVASLRSKPTHIGVWRTDTGALVHTHPLRAAPVDLQLSDDNAYLAVVYPRAVEVWAVDTPRRHEQRVP